jgi:hypothetical protein
VLDAQTSALLSEFGFNPATFESLMKIGIWLTIASLVAAIPTGMIAKRKGRSVTGWVVLELCIPLVPLLVVWLLPARTPPAQ